MALRVVIRPISVAKTTSSALSSSRQHNSTLAATDDEKLRTEYERAKPFEDIPGPKGLPYFGTLHQYRLGPYRIDGYHEALLDRYRKYGKIFKEKINGSTTVHLFDPDYARVIYQHEGKIPHIVPLLATVQMYRKYRNLSSGIGNSNGDDWYRLRTAVHRTLLTPKSVSAAFLSHVNRVAEDFMRRMERVRDPVTGSIANYDNEIAKWNLESCGQSCFEKRLGCLEIDGADSWQQKIIDVNTSIFQLTLKMRFSLPLHQLLPTPSWKRLMEAEDFFYSKGQALVDEAVEKVREVIDRGHDLDGRFSLLTSLMNRKDLSYSDLSVIILSVFTDGLSTTVPSLLGQLFCLASNPDKQDELFAEINRLIPDRGADVTDDVIQKSSYLKACIKEGFRFFPVGPDITRIPLKDIVIGGYRIPAGTHVSLNNNLLLRLPEYFDDPESYLPERWIRGGSAQDVHPYTLLPFGYGPRICAGMRFAEQEMRVLIIKLLQNFRISWPKPIETASQRYAILLKPNLAPRFQFQPRDH